MKMLDISKHITRKLQNYYDIVAFITNHSNKQKDIL